MATSRSRPPTSPADCGSSRSSSSVSPEGKRVLIRMLIPADGRAGRPHRCHPGDTDRIIASGWEVRDRAELQQVRKTRRRRRRALQAELSQGEPTTAASRRSPPSTTRLATPEVFHGAVLDHSLVVTCSGPGSSPATRAWAMWCCPRWTPTACSSSTPTHWDSGPAGPSRCRCRSSARPGAIFGINERHHSLAICTCVANARSRPDPHDGRSTARDAVGEALTGQYRRVPAVLNPGRHTNDKMVSFYVRAPGDRGHRVLAPAACGSTKPITPQRKSPRLATGATSGSAIFLPPCGHEFRRDPVPGIDCLGPRGGRGDRRSRRRPRRGRGGPGRRRGPGAGAVRILGGGGPMAGGFIYRRRTPIQKAAARRFLSRT